MLVFVGLPVITKRMALHRHPPPCRSNMSRSMKNDGGVVKPAERLCRRQPGAPGFVGERLKGDLFLRAVSIYERPDRRLIELH